MFKKIVPSYILDIVPYKPGKPIAEVKRELGLDRVIKMASNENPLGPSPKAVEAIKRQAGELNYYPEDSGYYLKKKLCVKHNITMDMLYLGNGSSEIIVNVGRAFLKEGDEILTSKYSFVMYYLCGAYTGNRVRKVPMKDYKYDLNAIVNELSSATKVIFLANPNNPTGTYFNKKEWEEFLEKIPSDVLIVLDEAYIDYVDKDDYPNGLDYINKYPNLLSLRTFSKIYGLAGIRVGYAVGNPEVIDILNRVKLPFNANALGQEAAIAALDDKDFVNKSTEVNRKGREFLTGFFKDNEFNYVPTVTNFIMVKLPFEGELLFDKMQHRGVIIRPLKAFGIPDAIRVTIGREEENRVFTKVFMEEINSIEK